MFKRCLVLVLSLMACVLGVLSAPALAYETEGVGWKVNVRPYPTNLPPSGSGYIQLRVYDIGAAASTGTVTVTDMLPIGVTYTGAQPKNLGAYEPEPWHCGGLTTVTCTATEQIGSGSVHLIDLEVHTGSSGVSSNRATAGGGGALEAAEATDPVTVSSEPASFGFEKLETWASNRDGSIDTQAGSHPYEFVTEFDVNNYYEDFVPRYETDYPAGSEFKTVTANLPPGLIGDPNAVAQCTRQQFDSEACPASTQVGVDRTMLGGFGFVQFSIFNLVPPPGKPALFAFNLTGIKTFLEASVRSDGDYGITEHVEDLAQRQIISNEAVIWGVPADPRHDPERCAVESLGGTDRCGLSSGTREVPFLTLPQQCGTPAEFDFQVSGWLGASFADEASVPSEDASDRPVGYTGCAHLKIDPTISVSPDISQSDTPAGMTVDVKVPQEGLTEPGGVATADLQNTTVALPEGVVINPGQAAGLLSCQTSEDGVGTDEEPSCPSASKVGTVQIETPLLKDKLEGDVYLLQSAPPHLQLLVAASGDGVNVKLVGHVELDEQTGRLVTTFSNTPQLPFSDFKLAFSGGAQAALVTPLRCGSYTTASEFSPWSAPFSPDVFPQSSFLVTGAPSGGGCGATLPFAPTMIAGSTTDQAAGFTDFSLLLQRGDGQQRIQSLRFETPEGLLGMISKIPLCPEAQAAQGACSAASQIGHTVVEAGPGPYPLVVPQPGQPSAPIYLTGPYKGAPYGLSIVVPLVLGPFTLQTQVVRAKIEVDPHTAQLTVVTDSLPTIIDGIPADLRAIDAVIDRPEFMFNPSGCEAQSFSGEATSTEGSSASLGSHFQMGSCRSLAFKPNFKVSTAGKTSRTMGASLDAKIVYPTGNLGANQASSQSNIQSVKVDLPKQLPSRLTTLQKACPVATFDSNPAACPHESIVGSATAITPVLPVPLTGPAYFVSHAGESFPQLIVVLQGYGVTVDLVGDTFISKAGITSSTFKEVPDVPIHSFDLKLPQGKYSALAANGNLCKSKLAMPTAFVAHSGAVIHQSTPVTVTGCAKSKHKRPAKHKHKNKPRGKAR
jgi:hypothetical protein